MLTPIELQNTVLKGGMGYSKKDTDIFFDAIARDYEKLYKENVELKDKLSVLSDGLQYYKNMETTLQKALVLAEKTSEETQAVAVKKAAAIEKEAQAKAQLILVDAKNELGRIQTQIVSVIQEYEKYKAQFKALAAAQLELLDSEGFRLQKFYSSPMVEESTPDEADVQNLDLIKETAQKDTDNDFIQASTQESDQLESAPDEWVSTNTVETENAEEENMCFGQENMEQLIDFEFLDDNDE